MDHIAERLKKGRYASLDLRLTEAHQMQIARDQ